MNLISLFVMSTLSSNIILSKFLGICPFMGVSKNSKNAFNMGLAVTFVITLSSIITYFIYNYILVKTNTTYLKTVIFILVIASIVQALDIIIKRSNKKLHKTLGIYLPLITTNCAVLGTTLLNISNNYNFIETLIYSVGSGLGFMLVIYVFGTIREKINANNRFSGVPIALITASIMALIFSRYTI